MQEPDRPRTRVFALTMLRRYADKRRRRDAEIIEAAHEMGATPEGIAAILDMAVEDVRRALERSRVARESRPLLDDVLTVDEARERRLRQLAEARGLKLRRSAQRRRDDPDFGLYELVEESPAPGARDGVSARLVVEATTLDAVEEYLHSA